MVPALTIGDMSYGAGIEDIDIGVLIGGYYAEPGIAQFVCQRFALRLVELATNGLKSNSWSGTVKVLGVFIVSGIHTPNSLYQVQSRIANYLTSAAVLSSP